MNRIVYLLVLVMLAPVWSYAQPSVYVDDEGVMRWTEGKKEVQGFGVNYTVPFAHGYRSAKALGVDLKEAIDKDVYHFARLGFDAYRVHIWDTEISDTLGNLLENEHLDLFDYMIKQMQDRGMKMLLTPIAFWGNGWPEKDTWSPGFAYKYGKDGCLVNEDAIVAQENYLRQLMNHVNPYTGVAYKDDPAVVAFEVSNEPHHRQSADSVTRYLKKMVDAIKSTGCEKPIFYNITHAIQLVDAYFNAGIDGGTFQWYPTGLGAGEELQGNFLPNVDRYAIPFADNEQFKKAAKVVYEFDAADIGQPYIYPAMARSFRTAGIQWATHFAYDPTYMAYANTEYNTHYMNLIYTPKKALALEITGKVFHEIPRYGNYGVYPESASFGNIQVSYEDNIAIYNTDKSFIYTNHTDVAPKNAKKLTHLSGWGNSPVVKYNGTGAYFLDQVQKGVWRLEVLPDAAWIADPFGQNSLDRKLAEVVWNRRQMSIDLADLGTGFVVTPLNKGNLWKPEEKNGAFEVKPGSYLLVKQGLKLKLDPNAKINNIRLNEYTAPATMVEKTSVLHQPLEFVNVGQGVKVKATIVSPELPKKVTLLTYDGWNPVKLEMTLEHGFDYVAEIPGNIVRSGYLSYYILIDADKRYTYPEGIATEPGEWDFDSKPYAVPVVDPKAPIYIYNALSDNDEVSRVWKPGSYLAPTSEKGKAQLVLNVEELFTEDPENVEADPIYDYSMRYNFKRKLVGRKSTLAEAKKLVFTGANLKEATVPVQVTLVQANGQAFGATIELGKEGAYEVNLSDLKPVDMVILPRPYPSFLPYYFDSPLNAGLDLDQIETLQISIGPDIPKSKLKESFKIAIESVRLQ